MWSDDESKEFKKRIAVLSDEELLKMVGVEADDYTEEALECAEAELKARGIEFGKVPTVDKKDNLVGEHTVKTRAGNSITCSSCGGGTRSGILFAEREVRIVFSDNEEERYVDVYACKECGRVEMIVDYTTEVEE
jgi:hypothetical protein